MPPLWTEETCLLGLVMLSEAPVLNEVKELISVEWVESSFVPQDRLHSDALRSE
jgi:hypothetical protein